MSQPICLDGFGLWHCLERSLKITICLERKIYSESALILRVQNSPLLFPIDIQNFFIVALVPLCYQEKKDIGSNLITLISSGS